MKITRVEATHHVVEVKAPLIEEPLSWGLVFVRVETDSGIAGYGLTGAIQARGVRELVNREIAPIILGQDPLATEHRFHDCFYRLNPRWQTGAFSSAVSAVDIALWDLKGKHFKEPVWRLLGGAHPELEVYITFGLGEYRRDQLAEAAKTFIAQGHTRLKMVVAPNRDAVDVNEDAARVRALREGVGEGAEIFIDANYKLPYHRALELCKKVERYGITWFEEPVYGNDARLLADLRRQTSIPIAAGQMEGSIQRHREFLEHGSVDILQPNVAYVGGYTQGAKVAAMAQAYNLPVANGGGWPHLNAHLLAGVDNGWRVEFHLLMWRAAEAIFKSPFGPVKGRVTLPASPGLGLEPNEDVLRATRVK